jgi:hypothetical protein
MSKNRAANPVPLTVKGARPAAAAGRISRREAMEWVLAAIAASSLPASDALAQPVGRTPTPQENASTQPAVLVKGGYGVDPNLVKGYKPGELWPLTFNEVQKTAAAALADTILPKDALGPAASEVGVVEMVDEWVSAPYPQQQADRTVVLDGLAWIDTESNKRFGKPFAGLDARQKQAICDDICFPAKAKNEFKTTARFFARFRSLCAGAYYATPEGWKAIGYVGNVALPSFDGPPAEVLERLGVTQTVK